MGILENFFYNKKYKFSPEVNALRKAIVSTKDSPRTKFDEAYARVLASKKGKSNFDKFKEGGSQYRGATMPNVFNSKKDSYYSQKRRSGLLER